MALTALETRPIEALTADDVQAFVAAAPAETETLEFKREPEGFAVRRAICGLANAYGGTFVLGVAERDGAAAAIFPLQACSAEAGRIAQGLAATLSPPLPGLRIRAIATDGEAGVVVIRVPASARRPHSVSKEGRGDALHVFVRRGAETRPADIREVQDMTLVAASQAERARERIEALQAPVLADRSAETMASHRPTFLIQFSAVPVSPVVLPRLDADRSLELGPLEFETPYRQVRFRHLSGRWAPMFRALRMRSSSRDYRGDAKLYADGACEIRFWSVALTASRHSADEEVKFYLGWFHALAVARILWCEKIRKAADDAMLEFALGDLIACDYAHVELSTGDHYDGAIGRMIQDLNRPELGRLATDADVQTLLNQATVDFYNLAGAAAPDEPVVFDLAALRQEWGLDDG